ncbi:hypothetical protein NX722_07430 [Endozoicomonas gorgoniicola]|uniref:Uncharacterized protein n=1 Tax=Endozoicomonas gorgoniicola TaxID=1234144 RepID=A0ABT3MTR8_9GAMM|nr:hypothetical protein [Endozoicomonas gorgoniicola]MCW7552478.1 hypothetical protein [Endozoicomonas gorgoniicola]
MPDPHSGRYDTSIPVNPRYQQVLAAILQDPNNELVVIEYNLRIAGMLQLTFIPCLSHRQRFCMHGF